MLEIPLTDTQITNPKEARMRLIGRWSVLGDLYRIVRIGAALDKCAQLGRHTARKAEALTAGKPRSEQEFMAQAALKGRRVPLEKIYRPMILTDLIVDHSQDVTGADLESKIIEGCRQGEGTLAILESDVGLACMVKMIGQIPVDLSQTPLVGYAFGQSFGLVQVG